MLILSRRDEDCLVIEVHDVIDGENASSLQRQLFDLIEGEQQNSVVLDVHAPLLYASALTVLLACHQRADADGHRLLVLLREPLTRTVVRLAGLHDVLNIITSLPSAGRSVPKPDLPAARSLSITMAAHHYLGLQRGLALLARFEYAPADPFVVTLTLGVGEAEQACWRLSRELLQAGMDARAGMGDVRVWPAPGRGVSGTLRLRIGPEGDGALFEVDRSRLAAWLSRTFDVVPPQREGEHVDWDAEARHLIADS
ncbi:SsgA family sporulation/cell division regulator [Streptomyces sp. NPDC051320]|uniref:SsgA family sporulation/cell division regulator n=1 Tax=Streptomyces sp. NPDC051320 TaxID=3154644 RepID=UPI00342B645D